MSKFDITPSDLQGMIGKIRGYKSQVKSIGSNMRSYANNLGNTWRDPRYQVFVGSVEAMGKQLQVIDQALERMEKQLKVLKRNLEKADQDFKRDSR